MWCTQNLNRQNKIQYGVVLLILNFTLKPPEISGQNRGRLIYIAELSRNVLLSLNCHNYNIDDNNNN